jgi:hypothetical protein
MVWLAFWAFFTNSSGHPGANPTTLSYNVGVVKIYRAIAWRVFRVKLFFADLKTL